MVEDLREFFYVDVDRVRSLLAQLQGGVVEAIRAQSTNAFEGGGQASVFGIGAHGGYTREIASEESRSLQDLTFVAFEQTANEEGLIVELGAEVRDPTAWESGQIHSSLQEGQLVRIDCDIQVLDGGLFGARIKRFELMAEALVEITDAVPALSNQKQRAQLLAKAKEEIMGFPSTWTDAIAGFVAAFVGDSISLRVLPCGREHLEYAFSGALLGRKEYIQEERENLFSRYGAVTSRWTAVMQVAAIPQSPNENAALASPTDSLRPSGDISRAAMERIAGDLLAMMESIGIVEGPRWPSISVTPLGLYRTVPRDLTLT